MNLNIVGTECAQFSFNILIIPCTSRLTESVWEAPLELHEQIFLLGSRKQKLFKITSLPLSYKRFVDGTLAIFSSRLESRCFFNTVNKLHPTLTLTCEYEHKNSLPFLSVLVERTNFGWQTSIYHKRTFSGLYTRWDSICPPWRKINLIKTFVHRGLMIYSKHELDFIKTKPCWKMDTPRM